MKQKYFLQQKIKLTQLIVFMRMKTKQTNWILQT